MGFVHDFKFKMTTIEKHHGMTCVHWLFAVEARNLYKNYFLLATNTHPLLQRLCFSRAVKS